MSRFDKTEEAGQPTETPGNYQDDHRNQGNKRRKEKAQFNNFIPKDLDPKVKNLTDLLTPRSGDRMKSWLRVPF